MTVAAPDDLPGADAGGRRPSPAELERIFGTDPVSTRDDLPDPAGPSDRDATESWYLDNRPPHHGG